MVSFAGRWEAKFAVPSGGASVSATVANGGSAATVTVPQASYYLTAAGPISGLVSTLQAQLNATAALHGFPRTAAVMDTVVGGDWTNGSGWLCQEVSGDLAPVFGAVTLADSGTPTYQNDGIKDGDYAVGFTGGADRFDGGNVFDTTGTDDLIVAWVGKWTGDATANSTCMGKLASGFASGWSIESTTTTNMAFRAGAAAAVSSTLTDILSGEWHVGIAYCDRGGDVLRIGIQGLTSGTQSLGSSGTPGSTTFSTAANFRVGACVSLSQANFLVSAVYAVSGAGIASGFNLSTALTNFANAINAAWSVSLSSTTGQVTIDWTGYATPTHSVSWTSTVLRDVLGFTANISGATSSTTGASQSPACWLPDAPLNVDGHPAMTPEETDLRVTESPTGVTLGLAGNTKYAHTNVRYRRCPVDRIREASASLTNASLEVFLRNTQFGQGDISWFTPASPCQVWWNSAGTLTLLGDDANSSAGVDGWTIVGISSFSQAVRLSQDGFVGHFDVTFPRLVSSG